MREGWSARVVEPVGISCQAISAENTPEAARVYEVPICSGYMGGIWTDVDLLLSATVTPYPIHASLQVVVNLDPAEPELGTVASLPSMHGVNGCSCQKPKVQQLQINHYLGSIGDFVDKTRRYWQVGILDANVLTCTN